MLEERHGARPPEVIMATLIVLMVAVDKDKQSKSSDGDDGDWIRNRLMRVHQFGKIQTVSKKIFFVVAPSRGFDWVTSDVPEEDVKIPCAAWKMLTN